MSNGWNAKVYKAVFDGDKTATIELAQPNRLHSILVAATSANLGGASLSVEGSHDGETFAPLTASPLTQTGLQPTVDSLLHSIRLTLSGHTEDVTITLASGLPSQQIQSIAGSVNVQEVTPA